MEKQKEILEKVVELFQKYGIRSITMDDISREMGMSKKTLYRYVQDKNDLVAQSIEHLCTKNEECLQQVMDNGMNAIDELLHVSKFITVQLKNHSSSLEYDLKKYYPDIYNGIHERKRKSMYYSILENMKKGKEEGLYREEMNEEIVARLHVLRMESMQDNPIFPIEELVRAETFKEMFIYHIRGIANEKGIDFLNKNIYKLEESEIHFMNTKSEN